MPVSSLMFTLFFHFAEAFVLNDSKKSLKKKNSQPVSPVYMVKNG